MNQTAGFNVKRPYLVVLLIELAIIVFVAGGSAYASIAELDHPLAPFIGFVPLAVFLAVYLTVKRRWTTFYFSGIRGWSGRQWLSYAPLLLVLALLLVANRGFDDHTASFFAYMLFAQIVLVGFVEEGLYRGIMLRVLMPKGKLFAVAVTSVLFGVTHALQALGGQSLEDTVLQIVYAFLIGGILALLVANNRAIWLAILFHGAHNFLNFTGNAPSTPLYDYAVIAILTLHLLWLLRGESRAVGGNRTTDAAIS